MTFRITQPRSWTLAELPQPATFALEDAAARLDALDATIAELGADPLMAAAQKASSAIRAGIALAGDGLKAAAAAYQKTLAGSEMIAKTAATRVPSSGFVEPGARDRAISAAMRSPFDDQWRAAVKDVADAKSEKAASAAKAAVDAMTALKDAIAAAQAKWNGPAALRLAIDMTRVSRIAALRENLEAYRPTAWLKQFRGLVAAGNAVDCEDFAMAVEPVANARAKLSLAQLGKELELPLSPTARNGGAVGLEQQAIHELRRDLAAWFAEQTPAHVRAAPQLYSMLLGAFSLAYGFNALLVSRQEFEKVYLSADPPNELAVHANWFVRALPGIPPVDALPKAAASPSPWR